MADCGCICRNPLCDPGKDQCYLSCLISSTVSGSQIVYRYMLFWSSPPTLSLCRDPMDLLDLLAKTDPTVSLAPSDPLDHEDAPERPALLWVYWKKKHVYVNEWMNDFFIIVSCISMPSYPSGYPSYPSGSHESLILVNACVWVFNNGVHANYGIHLQRHVG